MLHIKVSSHLQNPCLKTLIPPGEALVAVRALVVLLSGVDPVVSVQLVGAGEPPGAVGPRADVGLVADVRAEVRAQVRRLLVLGTDSTEKIVALVFGSKNCLRFRLESATCPNYPC